MTLDLFVLGLTAFAALFGALKGAARQVATALGALAAWFAAGPSGRFFGSAVAARLGTSLTIGTVVASIATFVLVYLVVQVISAAIIRRVLAGRDPDSRLVDRVLGLTIGGLKMFAMLFMGLCAATFFENNVVVAGKKFAFTPRDSVLIGLARQYNVLEMQQFSGVKDLVRVVKLQSDPQGLARLKNDQDFARLAQDPRFKKALSADGMRKALETGDVRALLQNNAVIELIQDPDTMRRLERVGERSAW